MYLSSSSCIVMSFLTSSMISVWVPAGSLAAPDVSASCFSSRFDPDSELLTCCCLILICLILSIVALILFCNSVRCWGVKIRWFSEAASVTGWLGSASPPPRSLGGGG